MNFRIMAAAAVVALSAGAVQAASISVTTFSVGDYNTQLGLLGTAVGENFEGFTEGNRDNGFSTAVGTFSTLGGTGSGGTVTDPDPGFPGVNDGTKLAIRDGNVYGRSSTTALLTGNPEDDKFLDSNDTWGIEWLVNVGSMFDRLIFTLTDATDQKATLTISADGADPVVFSGLGPSNRQLVVIDFGGRVSNATITLANTDSKGKPKTNDGLSIDDIAVSVVPLPAPALLLIGGLAGLAAFRRKRATA
jgi:hypothetical protein